MSLVLLLLLLLLSPAFVVDAFLCTTSQVVGGNSCAVLSSSTRNNNNHRRQQRQHRQCSFGVRSAILQVLPSSYRLGGKGRGGSSIVLLLAELNSRTDHDGGENKDVVVATEKITTDSLSSSVTTDAAAAARKSPRRKEGQQQQSQNQFRKIRSVEKFARLPVWPAWNGAFIWVVSKIFGSDIAAQLENVITGRVCPNFFKYQTTSPFIMLVHHCHSFAPWDPFRYIQRTFFPEGFPAHPHRGFVTLTYFMNGGFVHRDSIGCKQRYGHDETVTTAQWLNTGAGVLHEEMFDNTYGLEQASPLDRLIKPIRQELYQLWINVPASEKMNPPSSVLLSSSSDDDDEKGTTVPLVVTRDENDGHVVAETLVLAGSYQGRTSDAPIASEMTILHVKLYSTSKETATPNDDCWTIELPSSFQTALLYVRSGRLVDSYGVEIPAHHTAYFEPQSSPHYPPVAGAAGSSTTTTTIQLKVAANAGGADFMFLAGVPIQEPCVAQGSMVMTSHGEINQAYADYQRGLFGRPWDSSLTDEEWIEHVQQHPSQYR